MTNATRRITIAAFGILGVSLLAGAIALLPAAQQAGTRSASAATVVVTTSGGSATFTQGPGEVVSSGACTGSSETYGNMSLTFSPCVSYGFPSATLKNATLDTRQVLAFIKGAYEYHLVYFAFSRTNHAVTYAVLNVTGSQVVTGNYTTGYHVSYVGDRLLNVTVLQVVSSHFQVTHLSAYALPDRNASVVYTRQEAQTIQVALSDPKVESLIVGGPYYAEFIGSSGNATLSQTYLVQLYQVDGPGMVGAFVSSSLDSVVSSYAQERVTGECWPDGIVITDPWGEAGSIACKA